MSKYISGIEIKTGVIIICLIAIFAFAAGHFFSPQIDKFIEDIESEKIEEKKESKEAVVPTAILGVEVETRFITSSLQDPEMMHTSVFVSRIYENTPAESVGIKKGDEITGLNNKSVTSATEFNDLMCTYRPGQKIKIAIARKVDGDWGFLAFLVTLDKIM